MSSSSSAGCSDVETTTLEVAVEYESVDELWEPAIHVGGPGGPVADALGPEELERARAIFEEALGRPNGTFRLSGRSADGARDEGLTMWDSDAAYDNFMGRFSSRLAPLFADFAGVDSRRACPRRRRRDRDAHAGARAPRRAAGGDRAGAGFRRVAAPRASPTSTCAKARPSTCRGTTALSTSRSRSSSSRSWTTRRPAPPRCARVANGRVAVCMWDMKARSFWPPSITFASAWATRRRSRLAIARHPSSEELLGADAEVASDRRRRRLRGVRGLLGVAARRRRADGRVDSVARRRTAARLREAELIRELGDPSGPFTLTGRCWAARRLAAEDGRALGARADEAHVDLQLPLHEVDVGARGLREVRD